MKFPNLIFLFLTSTICFGQISGILLNQESKEPIPYAHVVIKGERIGATSNAEGLFELPVDSSCFIIINAVGFQTGEIELKSNFQKIELLPKNYVLNEVAVVPNAIKKENTTGKIRKRPFLNSTFTNTSEYPFILARQFEFSEKFSTTPYLKEVVIATESKIDSAKINLRFYSVSLEGKPGRFPSNQNFILNIPKGNKKTTFDISDLLIEFPKEGLFVAFEYLIIETNKYQYDEKESKKKEGLQFHYEPTLIGKYARIIGKDNKNLNTYYYKPDGTWKSSTHRDNGITYCFYPTVEIILTN